MNHPHHNATGSAAAPHSSGSGTGVHPVRVLGARPKSRKERTLALASAVQWGRGGPKRLWLASVAGIAEARISRAFSAAYPDTLSDEAIARIEAALSMGVAA